MSGCADSDASNTAIWADGIHPTAAQAQVLAAAIKAQALDLAAGVWPPAGSTDLTAILVGTTAIWSEQFASLSLRTGGYATGSLTTGYNASTSRGTWAYNGENYMTTASTYPGLSAFTHTPNANFNWQATDATFPPLGMVDIIDAGLLLNCAYKYPAIQAAVGTVSGNTPYLGAFLSTAPSARFATPYLRRIRFKFRTMGSEDFPALWSGGEHYAVDIANPAFFHYEIDDVERFGSDTTATKVAISTHIDPGTGIVSAGGDYNTGVAVGPDVLQEIVILHTDTQILAWWNGALAWNITPPAGSAKVGDRHHVIVNEILNPTFHAYTAASPPAQIVVRSVEILKPAAVGLDMIPLTPPVPVITWGGSFPNGEFLLRRQPERRWRH